MAYIFSAIIAGLFFLALHYFTEFTKLQKITVTTILLAIILSAILYNSYSNAQSQKMLEAVRKFEQNKTVKCKNEDVNSTNYTLSIGTYTFIGKHNTPYFNQMISVSECE
ncbi:MAG: hypothetical protein NTW78_04740 [Campylobacterales bacterium]|nr:hypothetical protein [Campylobacterales bacterium]